jgi:hypothetical protein
MSRNLLPLPYKIDKTNYYVGPGNVEGQRCDETIVSRCPGRSGRWRRIRHLQIAKRDG